MAIKLEPKEVLKIEREILHKEISSLKSSIMNYKVERKANWTSFKKKTNEEIDTISKLIDRLSIPKNK